MPRGARVDLEPTQVRMRVGRAAPEAEGGRAVPARARTAGRQGAWAWWVAVLIAFAIAMGHLEAVVVVYIREIMGLVPTPDKLTPEALGKMPGWIIAVEETREAATILMLVCVALLAGRNGWQRLGAFLLAFGVWDITYYVALKVMIGWPASLATQDLLFLIPDPWYAPVWLPVAASCGMIGLGALCLRRGARG
jgi:hypothetical protein